MKKKVQKTKKMSTSVDKSMSPQDKFKAMITAKKAKAMKGSKKK